VALLVKNKRWPEGAIVYQIYPRSFHDSNADGIGDIPGVTAKLNYLKSFGVNAIWLSPFYPSPMADFGYDVADYCDVDPIFGTLSDMDDLIAQAHRKKIRIMVDLVPNHSSDEHVWFRQSRQSREGKFADWYIWQDPKGYDKKKNPIPPNNWLDIFTGDSAWQWEPARQQFYLHSFDVHQPDLNWSNQEVRDGIKDAMRFWLDRGVDGFRVDAVRFMGKDPSFKDNPKNPKWKKDHGSKYNSLIHKNSQGWPQLYSYLNEMAAVLKEPKYRRTPRFMVTESYPDTHEPVEEYLAFYQGMDPEVAAPFIFEGLGLPWSKEPWRKFLDKFHAALDDFDQLCIPSYAFGNHDQWRLATRRGEARARAAAVLLLTLPGMAFIYNGEEIGMKNGHIPEHLVQDPGAADGGGRDPERTPLQWAPTRNAGFSEAHTTWLPVADDYPTRNVESESRDPHSFLSLYRRLGKLRNGSNALKRGKFDLVHTKSEHVLVFTRSKGLKQHIIALNFSEDPATVKLPKTVGIGRLQASSAPDSQVKKVKDNTLHLHAYEAVVLAGK
jgi:alpha-glucosidase